MKKRNITQPLGRKMQWPQIKAVKKGEICVINDAGHKVDSAIYNFLWKIKKYDDRHYRMFTMSTNYHMGDDNKVADRCTFIWHARSSITAEHFDSMIAENPELERMFFTNQKFREFALQKFSDALYPVSADEFYKWDGVEFGRRGWNSVYPADSGLITMAPWQRKQMGLDEPLQDDGQEDANNG